VGERKLIRHEAPAGRRVNVVGAWAPFDPSGPRLVFATRRSDEGKYDAAAHLEFVECQVAGLPSQRAEGYRRSRPCVIVLDNYAVHHAQLVKDRIPALKQAGVSFFFIPPYSPELNMIEPIWRQVKHQDIPHRSFLSIEQLQDAVATALDRRSHSCQSTTHLDPSA
jgi:DDE superfamily endonuclease